MAFCPHCGNETDLVIPVAAAVAVGLADEVRIAEINAARDIELAKLARRQDADWNETRVEVAAIEADAEVAAAEATAEVVAAVIAGPDDQGDDDPAPIVVEAGPPVDDVVDDAPPPNDDAPAPSSPGKPRGLGMW